jgi:predicted transcriptional regulator
MKRLPVDFKPGMQGLNKVLGSLESEVMDTVWRKDCEVCVRDIYEDLALKREIAYTTVMTIMARLAEKNILVKRKEGNTSFYLPAMSRDEFTQSVVGSVVDGLLEDFAEATLSHFLTRVRHNDRETIEKLEKLLEAYKGGEADEHQ